MRRSLECVFLLALALALAPACASREPRREEAAALARSQTLVEEGNAFYRAGDYRNAARRYAAAVAVRKDDPAAHFGLGMALAKLGRDEDARASYALARDLAQQAREPARSDSAR